MLQGSLWTTVKFVTTVWTVFLETGIIYTIEADLCLSELFKEGVPAKTDRCEEIHTHTLKCL